MTSIVPAFFLAFAIAVTPSTTPDNKKLNNAPNSLKSIIQKEAAIKAPPKSYRVAACGYYVISGCFRSPDPAVRRARRIGGYVINTSSRAFTNFTPDYFCAVFGPYGYSRAKRKKRHLRFKSYIKNGC